MGLFFFAAGPGLPESIRNSFDNSIFRLWTSGALVYLSAPADHTRASVRRPHVWASDWDTSSGVERWLDGFICDTLYEKQKPSVLLGFGRVKDKKWLEYSHPLGSSSVRALICVMISVAIRINHWRETGAIDLRMTIKFYVLKCYCLGAVRLDIVNCW